MRRRPTSRRECPTEPWIKTMKAAQQRRTFDIGSITRALRPLSESEIFRTFLARTAWVSYREGTRYFASLPTHGTASQSIPAPKSRIHRARFQADPFRQIGQELVIAPGLRVADSAEAPHIERNHGGLRPVSSVMPSRSRRLRALRQRPRLGARVATCHPGVRSKSIRHRAAWSGRRCGKDHCAPARLCRLTGHARAFEVMFVRRGDAPRHGHSIMNAHAASLNHKLLRNFRRNPCEYRRIRCRRGAAKPQNDARQQRHCVPAALALGGGRAPK
jgi:hypothetical protein